MTGIPDDPGALTLNLTDYAGSSNMTFNFLVVHDANSYTPEVITKYFVFNLGGLVQMYMEYYEGMPRYVIKNLAGLDVETKYFQVPPTGAMTFTLMRTEMSIWKYSAFYIYNLTNVEVQLDPKPGSTFT